MKYLRWLALLAFLVMAWNFNLRPRVINGDIEVDIHDPAVEQLTQTHSKAYGGIDRWAFPGLESWRLLRRLQEDGYICTLPQDPATGGTPRSGLHAINCQQERAWPLSRRLLLRADMNYNSYGGRLVAATASSEIKPAAWREHLARLYRATGLMEPALLPVTGLQAASTDELARIVADTLLSYGWDSYCGDGMMSALCRSNIAARTKNGFPAVPAKPWGVDDIKQLQQQLGRIGFVTQRHAADSENYLAVRLEEQRLWLDMQRQDLSGRTEKLAVEIDPVGARAIRLVLTGKTGAREFALAGKAVTFNNEQSRQWLFPLQAGVLPNPADELLDTQGRKAIWLLPPTMDDMRERNEHFSASLPLIDPLFHPQLLTRYMDQLLQDNSAEMQLQLQPLLQSADRMAAALRASHVATLLSASEASSLISKHYQKQPLARVTWALYECENNDIGPLEIQPACWQRFVRNDPEAAGLLRADLARQSRIYAGLDPSNPVQRRLQRLAMAFSITGGTP